MQTDPLDDLYIRPEQIEQEQRELLRNLIIPYAGLTDAGAVHFQPKADDLTSKQKIMLYLLCRLALSARPDSSFSKYVSPKELEEGTGQPGGTVRPKLTQLVQEKLIAKSGDGYWIPSHYLHRIKEAWPSQD
jgi:hypothetical protein